MSEDLRRLGEAVVSARQAKGWSRRELALHTELAESTVARLESGNHETSANAHKWVEQALEWEPGTIAAMLNGGVAAVDESSAPPRDDKQAEDVPEPNDQGTNLDA